MKLKNYLLTSCVTAAFCLAGPTAFSQWGGSTGEAGKIHRTGQVIIGAANGNGKLNVAGKTVLKDSVAICQSTIGQEALDVNGAINLGTTTASNAGTIRWTGTHFEGYNGTSWIELDQDLVVAIFDVSLDNNEFPIYNSTGERLDGSIMSQSGTTVTVSGALTATGQATVGSLTTAGLITSTNVGTSSFSGTVSAADLDATDDLTVGDDATITGDATVGSLTTAGLISSTNVGTSSFSGTVSAADLDATDDLTVGDDATITGDATVGSLTTAGLISSTNVGTSSFSGTVSAADLDATDDLTVADDATITGDATVGSLTTAGLITSTNVGTSNFSGTISAADLDATDDLTVGDAATITGVATVGSLTTAGTITSTNVGTSSFSGTVSAADLDATDDLTVGDDATITGDLTASGAVTFDGLPTSSSSTVLGIDVNGVVGEVSLNSIMESDPQVSSATTGSVPVWNGTTLVDGSITDAAGAVSTASTVTFSNSSINLTGLPTTPGNLNAVSINPSTGALAITPFPSGGGSGSFTNVTATGSIFNPGMQMNGNPDCMAPWNDTVVTFNPNTGLLTWKENRKDLIQLQNRPLGPLDACRNMDTLLYYNPNTCQVDYKFTRRDFMAPQQKAFIDCDTLDSILVIQNCTVQKEANLRNHMFLRIWSNPPNPVWTVVWDPVRCELKRVLTSLNPPMGPRPEGPGSGSTALEATVNQQQQALESQAGQNEEMRSEIDILKGEIADLRQMLADVCNGGCEGINNSNGPAGTPADGSSLSPSELYQNSPNPFRENTVIRYALGEGVGQAQIFIYNLAGVQLSAYDLPITAGNGTLQVSAKSLEAGQYLYTLVVDGQEVATKKMLLTR